MEKSKEIREAFRKFAEETTGWMVKDPGIEYIRVNDNEYGDLKISEGKVLNPSISDTPGERVLAIFESNAYLVVTPNRGGLKGMPYLYGTNKVYGVKLKKKKTIEIIR